MKPRRFTFTGSESSGGGIGVSNHLSSLSHLVRCIYAIIFIALLITFSHLKSSPIVRAKFTFEVTITVYPDGILIDFHELSDAEGIVGSTSFIEF
jgi:hypothetical protein